MTIRTNGINQQKIEEYFKTISHKHTLDIESLISEWNSAMNVSNKTEGNNTEDNNTEGNNTEASLKKKLKKDLQNMCSDLGYSKSGTKDQLIARILGGVDEVSETKTKAVSKKAVSKKADTPKNPVATKLTAKIPVISIRRNQFGNHEHVESGMIFDPKTKKVIGKQNIDGSIDSLTPGDIDRCNQYKFDYQMPDNLDNKEGLDDVSVDELDDDDDESVVESDDDFLEEELLEEEEEEEEDMEEDF